MTEPSALVLFSGGQDSTTALAWALHRFRYVETAGFAYGQRHAIELACREPLRTALSRVHGNRLGMQRRFVLETPLMWLDKAATWSLAHQLGGDPLIALFLEHTHSC